MATRDVFPPVPAEERDLESRVPGLPPDPENEAIIFAKKTAFWTTTLAALFIAAAVVYTFYLN